MEEEDGMLLFFYIYSLGVFISYYFDSKPLNITVNVIMGYSYGIWWLFAMDFVAVPKGTRLLVYYEPQYLEKKSVKVKTPLLSFWPYVVVNSRKHELIPLDENAVAYETQVETTIEVINDDYDFGDMRRYSYIPASVHLTFSSKAVIKQASRYQSRWRDHLIYDVNYACRQWMSLSPTELKSGNGKEFTAAKIAVYLDDSKATGFINHDSVIEFAKSTGIHAVVTVLA